MRQRLIHVSLLVAEYDPAIAFYTRILGFRLVEDTRLSADKRWVLVQPPGDEFGCQILLARAASPEQIAQVGNQCGGRVFLFLETDDFERDYRAFQERGVRFVRPPSQESYGKVAVFEDLHGHRWDLIQRSAPIPS
jgi:catechol 2,3-dioxygenase-like lactoylglutathione lyase family enzyme